MTKTLVKTFEKANCCVKGPWMLQWPRMASTASALSTYRTIEPRSETTETSCIVNSHARRKRRIGESPNKCVLKNGLGTKREKGGSRGREAMRL